jgi:hypothetical protein
MNKILPENLQLRMTAGGTLGAWQSQCPTKLLICLFSQKRRHSTRVTIGHTGFAFLSVIVCWGKQIRNKKPCRLITETRTLQGGMRFCGAQSRERVGLEGTGGRLSQRGVREEDEVPSKKRSE